MVRQNPTANMKSPKDTLFEIISILVEDFFLSFANSTTKFISTGCFFPTVLFHSLWSIFKNPPIPSKKRPAYTVFLPGYYPGKSFYALQEQWHLPPSQGYGL